MPVLNSLLLILNLSVQAAGTSPTAVEIFTPKEKNQFALSRSINSKIRIYDEASVRIQQDLKETIKKERFETVPIILTTWVSLLQTSISDIETDGKANNKSKQLRKFEIHIRKAIKDLQYLKLKVPHEQYDAFASGITAAEAIRKKMIDILFKH